MPLAMGESYDSSVMAGESSSGEFKRLSIDELCRLGCVAVHAGDDMYLKLPDVNGRGGKVENVDGGVKGGVGVVETSDGLAKVVVRTGCNGDALGGS